MLNSVNSITYFPLKSFGVFKRAAMPLVYHYYTHVSNAAEREKVTTYNVGKPKRKKINANSISSKFSYSRI